jgi:hypothetical protein
MPDTRAQLDANPPARGLQLQRAMCRNPLRRGSLWRRFFRLRPTSATSSLGALAVLFAVLSVAELTASSRSDRDPFASTTCFPAGTSVLTEDGPRAIERITVGTRVWARDEFGDAHGWKPVVQTFERQAESLVHLTLEDADGGSSTLAVTPNHPLFVVDRGWSAAGALVPGRDQLIDDQGRRVAVRAAERVLGNATVYNLEVADHRTYFAGTANVWAHNRCETIDPLSARASASTGAADLVPWRHD